MDPLDLAFKLLEKIVFIAAGFCRNGRAREDRVRKYVFELNGQTYTLLLVLDGHSVPSCIDDIKNVIVLETSEYLPALILQHLSEGASAEDAIKNAHLNLQAEFEKKNFFKFEIAGTCTGGALIFGNTCVAFNLGDITVGLVDEQGNHRELSKHHNAANPEERKRLKDLGVYISRDGRIGDYIMVSGALGDVALNHLHLMKTPHTETISLSPGDKVFVTSDGVIGGNGYGLTFTRVAELVHENCVEKDIVSNAIASLNGVDPRRIDDASCIIYSHEAQVLTNEPCLVAFDAYNQECKTKLENLRKMFTDDELRQIALDWIRAHLESLPNPGETGYNDDESIWTCDAYKAWSGNIDEDVIKYWPIPPLDKLLSKE